MSIFGGGTASKPTPPAATLRVQTSIFGKPKPIVYGQVRLTGNLIGYDNFSSKPASGGGKSGGKGGGGGGKGGKGGSGSYTYSAFLAIGICEGPGIAFVSAWNGSTGETYASLNLSGFDGSYTQTPWSWMVSNHPDQALAYRGLAYLVASPFELGGSPVLPNLNYEVASPVGAGAIAGLPDADPSVVIPDYLTNANYGVGFPGDFLGSLAVYRSMCLAAGLVISDALVSQTAANSYLADLLDATNSEFVWSSGLLTIVPYGDVGSINGNGYSYSPPSVPLFSLTDDDFMPNQGGTSSYSSTDPVAVSRKRRSDAVNSIQVEYLDRSNAYNPAIATAMDDAAIATYGLRTSSTKTMHFFTLASAAVMAANLQLRRQGALAILTFTLDQRFIVLDPMDLVEITDVALGLVSFPVLIKEMTENADGSLTFVAEGYLGATSAIPAHGVQVGAGFAQDYNVAPPTTNPPIVFAAPPQIAGNQGLELWLVASGPDGWGGCDIWISGDGSTYMNVGRMIGPCRQGVLAAPVAPTPDPDTLVVIPVDLSSSHGELLSGTTADADNANTLCYLDGELITYSDASLTSQYRYTLDTYIRRGVYGTANAAHAAGAPFARLDSQVFRYPYSVDQIGKPLYVKLTAFNIFGGGEEALSDVTPTELTIPAPPAPSVVTGFSVVEKNDVVVFTWSQVNDFALAGYYIGYAAPGTTSRTSFQMLTEEAAGSEMTNGSVPAGTWSFGIWARDIAGQFGPGAFADMTITNQEQVIAEPEQSPLWPGAISGFLRHYTGVLVPLGTNPASHYTAWEDFTNFVVDPVSTASYTALVIDTGYNDDLRVHATSGYTLGPGQTGTPTLGLSIDTWLTGAADPGTFTAWTIGTTNLRYVVARLTYSGITAGNVAFVTEFAPIVDTATPPVAITQSATIAAGGSAVSFDATYHLPPAVFPTPVSGAALYANAHDITAAGCTINVWDTSGISVGGVVNIKIEGE
jgi:hypothetical protein